MQKKSFSTFTVVNIKFKNFWRSNGLIGKIELFCSRTLTVSG